MTLAPPPVSGAELGLRVRCPDMRGASPAGMRYAIGSSGAVMLPSASRSSTTAFPAMRLFCGSAAQKSTSVVRWSSRWLRVTLTPAKCLVGERCASYIWSIIVSQSLPNNLFFKMLGIVSSRSVNRKRR